MKQRRPARLHLFITISLIMASAWGAAAAWAAEPDFKAMLKTIDTRSNFSGLDLTAKMLLVSDDPERGHEVKSARTFRRDSDDAFLTLFLEPKSQLGQGYLKVDDNLWFYDPESRKFTHTSLKENVQGTDMKNSDFGQSSLASDYKITKWSEGKLGAYEVWLLDLEATNNEATYPFKKIAVSKKDELLLKSEDYSLSRRLLRTAYYPSYAKAGSSYIADKTLFVDALVSGKKTQMSMSEISVAPIPDSVFTKAYVERVNR
ncbi:outer membrane lipoprotein-sorting protein [Treponema sp.]